MSNDLINVTVEGIVKMERLAVALEPDDNIQAILDEGCAVVFNHMRTRFLQQVNPDGTPWPPSKAAQRRARLGRGGGTLFRTGKLWRSLQLSVEDANTRSIGTDVDYAKFHQFGTIHLPQRIIIGFGPDDVQAMEEAVIHRLATVLSKGV